MRVIGITVARWGLLVALVLLAGAPAGARGQPAAASIVTDVPGATFRECPQCPEMIVVPSGKFSMGDVATDNGQELATSHRVVEIRRPFALGKYDVTRGEYAAFVRATGRRAAEHCYDWRKDILQWADGGKLNWRDPGFPQTDRDPVVCVSLEDAEAYARWLNAEVRSRESVKASGDGPYRIPREEEWEYAGRGGTASPYFWGDAATRENANYGADACPPCGPGTGGRDAWVHTAPVGSFPPNPLGLYDMAGNVWQWTESCLDDALPPFETSGRCKRGFLTNNDDMAVIRGGSWLDTAEYLRVGRRAVNMQFNRNNTLGFRVLRDLE